MLVDLLYVEVVNPLILLVSIRTPRKKKKTFYTYSTMRAYERSESAQDNFVNSSTNSNLKQDIYQET